MKSVSELQKMVRLTSQGYRILDAIERPGIAYEFAKRLPEFDPHWPEELRNKWLEFVRRLLSAMN